MKDVELIRTIEALSRLTAERDVWKAKADKYEKALAKIKTDICGYALTDQSNYPHIIERFYREVRRMDEIARAALQEDTP